MNYNQATLFLESLYNLIPKDRYSKREAQTVYFEQMYALLNLLGNPHKKLKFIHVTGTSGKSSTAHMCQNMLQAAGYKVGLYQSPHLTTYIERIRVNDKFISAQDTIRLINELKIKLEKYLMETDYDMIAFGGLSFCMALVYFVEQQCDYVVVEVGCGGKCDHTNIIPPPEVAIITNIGKDHLKTLGPTLADIAREKSGIIKKGCHVVTTEKKKRYQDIFEHQAHQIKATLHKLSRKQITNISQTPQTSSFIYKGISYNLPIPGIHQIENSLLVIETGLLLGISPDIIQKGLKKFNLAARFEVMQQNPLVILDGAHNAEKLTSTFANLELIKHDRVTKKIWCIFSFTDGKDIQPIAKMLTEKVDKLLITRHNHVFRKALPLKTLKTAFKKINKPIDFTYFLDAHDAYRYAIKHAKKDDIILITGSLYMAGIVRQQWYSEEFILKNRKMH